MIRRILKKTAAVAVVSMMVCSMFTGCGKNGETKDTGVKTVRAGAMPYYLSVPLQVIKDEKLDQKYGYQLEIIDFPSGGPMAEALGAGEWDIGPIGAGGMIAIPNYNAKLIADVEYEMDGAWIFARPDSEIAKAGKNLTYRNLRRQLTDSLEDKPFPKLPEELQKHTFWEFGSKEEHFKYRSAVMQTYIYGNFPVFEGFNHMQYQIRDPEGFARMLETIMETDRLPKLTFAI